MNEEIVQLNTRLPKSLRHRMNVCAAQADMKVNDLVIQALYREVKRIETNLNSKK